jgi:hypothetical protein
MDNVDPAILKQQVSEKLDEFGRQLVAYRKEARDATRPRRKIVGVWAAIAVAWMAAATVSVVTIVALAEKTAGTNDGKIAWVVFVAFAAAIGATFLAVVRGGD